jgi:hypothetical protein
VSIVYFAMKTVAASTAAVLLLGEGVHAWPGMHRSSGGGSGSGSGEGEDYIGPACTVGAHNWHPESGPCPNTPQPAAPGPSSGLTHLWPSAFTVQWEFYFVPDDADAPPYTPLPTTPYNVTTGRTFYYNNEATGERNMKEVYDQFCIPVFGNPLSPMGRENQYSCDFLNVGSTNTSYVVLHEDRPPHTPECCIIGKPFHAPPQDFATLMPVHWTEPVGDVMVDWNAVEDKDAGIFSYGFISESVDEDSIPFAFYMKGTPWVANWMWQAFSGFTKEEPPASVWEIPAACDEATACPGW